MRGRVLPGWAVVPELQLNTERMLLPDAGDNSENESSLIILSHTEGKGQKGEKSQPLGDPICGRFTYVPQLSLNIFKCSSKTKTKTNKKIQT